MAKKAPSPCSPLHSMGPTNLAQKRSEPMCFFETNITCECECASRQNGNLEIQTGIKAQVILPTPGQKTNRTNKKLPGTQGKICGPRTPI